MSNDDRQLWACSHCGPHRSSTATWCAKGCGRDYNRMYVAAAHGTTEYWQQVAEVVTDDLREARADYARWRALVSWIDGMLVDGAGLMEIREGISAALAAGVVLGGGNDG